MNRIGIEEVASRLSGNIENLCSFLLPQGKKNGPIYEVGSIYGEPGKTLKVNLTGTHQGHWCDWNGAEHKGDALDLWAAAKGIPLPEALKQAKEWLGIREPVLPEKSYKRPEDDRTPLAINGKTMQWLVTERKLPAAIVNRYKVQGDPKAQAIVFPCYGPDGVLVNRSWRTLEELSLIHI